MNVSELKLGQTVIVTANLTDHDMKIGQKAIFQGTDFTKACLCADISDGAVWPLDEDEIEPCNEIVTIEEKYTVTRIQTLLECFRVNLPKDLSGFEVLASKILIVPAISGITLKPLWFAFRITSDADFVDKFTICLKYLSRRLNFHEGTHLLYCIETDATLSTKLSTGQEWGTVNMPLLDMTFGVYCDPNSGLVSFDVSILPCTML